jgi:hypothetical protein
MRTIENLIGDRPLRGGFKVATPAAAVIVSDRSRRP